MGQVQPGSLKPAYPERSLPGDYLSLKTLCIDPSTFKLYLEAHSLDTPCMAARPADGHPAWLLNIRPATSMPMSWERKGLYLDYTTINHEWEPYFDNDLADARRTCGDDTGYDCCTEEKGGVPHACDDDDHEDEAEDCLADYSHKLAPTVTTINTTFTGKGRHDVCAVNYYNIARKIGEINVGAPAGAENGACIKIKAAGATVKFGPAGDVKLWRSGTGWLKTNGNLELTGDILLGDMNVLKKLDELQDRIEAYVTQFNVPPDTS